MSDFTGGSREKTIVFGILAALVVALVVLAQQLLSGPDDEEAAPPPDASVQSGGSGDEGVGDVMALMPYSEAELEAGAETARAFVAAYSEVRPEENGEERIARLSPMLAEEFFGTMEALILTAPNSATSRDAQRTSASASVTGIRNIGTSAVIFEVEARTLSDTGEEGDDEPLAYAVTMVLENDAWAVYAFQDASLGNDGEGV